MGYDYDIIVAGGGLAGLTAALACASKGAKVAIIDAATPDSHMLPDFDGRASAISASSFEMYRRLGIAARLGDEVQPIDHIKIKDGSPGGAMSAFALSFDSEDTDGGAMGYMIENRRLRRALLDAVAEAGIDMLAPARVKSYRSHSAYCEVHLEDGRKVTGAIIAAADGRGSTLRKLAKIGVRRLEYNQSAIVTTVAHERPHHATAYELFYPSGPFAILPITGHRSSIVWTDRPDAVKAAMALSEGAFRAELSRRFGDMYGEVAPIAPRWAYPLSLQMADAYTKERLVLVGDAAHAVHPIAGQGLNMGLRDGAALADIWHKAKSNGMEPSLLLSEYEAWRAFDNNVLAMSMDLLNRLFSNDIAPVRHLRRLGIGLVDKMRPARSFFIREAAGQTGDLPSLLRPMS